MLSVAADDLAMWTNILMRAILDRRRVLYCNVVFCIYIIQFCVVVSCIRASLKCESHTSVLQAGATFEEGGEMANPDKEVRGPCYHLSCYFITMFSSHAVEAASY